MIQYFPNIVCTAIFKYKNSFPMKKYTITFLFLAFLINTQVNSQVDPSRQWSSYRGPASCGYLDNAKLPDNFDLSGMKNILWKVEVPGLGLSSPVIWGEKLFITTAISEKDKSGFKPGIYGDVSPVSDSSVHEWKVLCYNRMTGKLLWEQTACKGVPAIKRHPKSTHANTSVATDGKYVVAFFGSEGMYCYNTDGKLLWKKSFGVLKSSFFAMPGAEWEYASSPVIYKGKVVIQCDVLGDSFVAALDVASGKELWRTKRDDYPTWSTPNIYTTGNQFVVVVNGYKHMGGYDLSTGAEIWRLSGGGDIPIPTPVIGKDLIYLNSAHGMASPIFAISREAKGDITPATGETSNQYVRWKKQRGGSYMQTLLLYNNHLYNLGWNGNINCFDPETGNEIFTGKLGKSKSFVASPVAADGRIYAIDEEGTVYIIKDGTGFSLVSEVALGDKCMTAPSVGDGAIYFRTQNYLIAAGTK